MKKLLLMCGALLAGVYLYAQNTTWILAPNYYDSFFGSTPLPIGDYTGAPAMYAQNIQMDKDGNLLFFIIDNKVYDKNGNVIEGTDGSFIIDELDSYQRVSDDIYFDDHVVMNGTNSEIVIIPDKNDCNLFHLFSSGHSRHGSPSNVFAAYGRLKISYMANGQLTPSSGFMLHSDGTYVASMRPIEDIIGVGNFNNGANNHHRTPSFAVIDEGNSYTVFYKNFNRLFRLTIDQNGISYNNYTDFFVGQIVDQSPDRLELEAIKLPNGNYRIASFCRAYPSPGIWGVFVCDVTSSGTLVSGSTKTLEYTYSLFASSTVRNFTGLEFNSTGSRVFVSHLPYNGVNGATLDYWDISGTPVKTEISTDGEVGRGQIETARDGNMYIPRNTRLARISNINVTPSVNLNAVTIPTYPTSIGYNQTPMRMLQDQIDGSNIYTNVDPSIFHVVTYDVTSGGTWNGGANPIANGQSVINVEKELRIKAGVSLTIQNMIFRFAPGARLVIENGTGTGQSGKLRLMNNTTLTNYAVCGEEEMWLGVEVWGNSTNVQGTVLNSTQGVLRIQSNSRIEHALIGVLASKRNESGGIPISHNSYDNNRNGGVVVVENASFFNCMSGIIFQPYTIGSTNLSSISYSTFTWNGLLKDLSLKPQAHIRMNNCLNINISRSNFYQQTPTIYSNVIDRGIGIYALNSTFSVYSGCNSFLPVGYDCPEANNLPSKFENLYTGVMAWNLNSRPFTVLRNEFTNCLYGVTSVTAKTQTISRNKFYIPESDAMQTWGIHVSYGTGYKIEENYLRGLDNPSISLGNSRTYGIIIDNSGKEHNEVYKNVFEELYVGTQAQGNNARIFLSDVNDSAGGLRYHCNEFKHPIHLADIGVNGRIDYEHGRVGGSTIHQARDENTARNKFSMFGENHTLYPDHDIMLYPGSQQINYVHLADDAHTPDNYTVNPPTSVYPYVQNWGGIPVFATEYTCPTRYPAIIPIIFEPEFFLGEQDKIDSLENMIDAGKTDQLLNLIASQPNESATYKELMNTSPYLSDVVLESYIRSGVSSNQLKQVLIANSGLSDYIWNSLNTSQHTELQKDLLMYQNKVSSRKLLSNDIKSVNEKLNSLQRDHISAIISDTTIASTSDHLEQFLEMCEGINFKKSLLSQYSSSQKKNKFDELLDNLSGHLSKERIELYRIQYTMDGYASMQEAVNQNESILSSLDQIVKTGQDEEAIYIAGTIITILDGKNIELRVLPLQAPKNSLLEYHYETSETDRRQAASYVVKLFPNPSKGSVTFHFSELESSSVNIQLIDLTGKEVFNSQFANTTKEQIDFSHLKKGAYLVKIMIDDQQSDAQLLILE